MAGHLVGGAGTSPGRGSAVGPAPGWLAGLDGLRAISILLVVLAHAAVTRGAPGWGWISRVPLTRATGVCLFFLISGYLITHLLLEERRRFGGISLPRFYARRALRILPASYALLVVCVLLRHAGWLDFSDRGLLASATYWRNYFRGDRPGDWVLDHTWSLSVEEQFYLLWPLIVSRCSRRAATGIAATGAVGWSLLRLLRHGALVQASGRAALDIAGMDTIFAGCLLALVLDNPRIRELVLRTVSIPGGGWASLLAILGLYAAADAVPRSLAVLLPLGRNALLLWLLGTALRPSLAPSSPSRKAPSGRLGARFDRLLAARPMVVLGRASYSLYLWQQLFLQPDHPSPLCRFPVNVAAGLLAAAISYYGIESPFNRMRARFAPLPRLDPTGAPRKNALMH